MNFQLNGTACGLRSLRALGLAQVRRPFASCIHNRGCARRLHINITCASKGTKNTAAKGFGAPKPQTKGVALEAQCPCGTGAQYETCCSPYHRGAASPPSPEALLRARYSAYVAKEPAFIADTTHPESPEYTGSRASYLATIKATMRRLDPLALTLVDQVPGPSPEQAALTFRLKRRIREPAAAGGAPGARGGAEVDEVTERSTFLRVNGRWFYVDSEFMEGEGAGAAAAVTEKPEEPPKKKGFFPFL